MKMKFFEKTYLLILVLFLVFFNASIFAISVVTFNNTMDTAQSGCLAECAAIKESFENDIGTLNGTNEGVYWLQIRYCNFYEEKGIFLRFERNETEIYSSIPEGMNIPKSNIMSIEKMNGNNYILISEETISGGYIMTYAKDISYLYDEFKALAFSFVGASLVTSVVLAVLLYFVLRKLYSPLEKLRNVTGRISEGDFSIRADESGNDEFAELAKDFNIMSKKINEQMNDLKSTAEQKQRMLDDLAHEMRTPLTSIHGYAEYIRNANISDEERTDAADFILKESIRLKSISEILLDVAFIRENKIDKRSVSVVELLNNTRERMLLLAERKNVSIEVTAEDVTLNGEKVLLELLMTNITENAIKACSDGGKVTLSSAYENGKAVICIEDNGIGMTKEQLEHITEPFYRTDKSRSRKEGGTGLGLALCDTIAKVHDATLEFQSERNKGTKVIISF